MYTIHVLVPELGILYGKLPHNSLVSRGWAVGLPSPEIACAPRHASRLYFPKATSKGPPALHISHCRRNGYYKGPAVSLYFAPILPVVPSTSKPRMSMCAIFGSYNAYDFPVPTKQSPEKLAAVFARCWRLWTPPSPLTHHAVSLDFVPGPAEKLPVGAPAAGQWPSSTRLW